MISTIVILTILNTGSPQPAPPENPVYRTYVDHKKRFSLSGTYKIEDEGPLVIYSQTGMYKTADHTFYYFSKTKDGPIMRFKMKNLRHVLHDPSVMKHLKLEHKNLLTRNGEHLAVNSIISYFSQLNTGH